MIPLLSTVAHSSAGDFDPHWDDVVLLLPMDVDIDDVSSASQTVTATDVTQDTSIKKFGAGSAYFDGSVSYLSCAASAGFSFGDGDFTIELFYRPGATQPTYTGLITMYDNSGSNRFLLGLFSNKLGFLLANINDSTPFISDSSNYTSNAWAHVALTRESGVFRLFHQGAKVDEDSSHLTSLMGYSDRALWIGDFVISGLDNYEGHIDSLRITKGVARYTADFTPPAQSFPTSGA